MHVIIYFLWSFIIFKKNKYRNDPETISIHCPCIWELNVQIDISYLILILNFLQNEVVGGDLGVAMPLVVFGLFAFVAGLLALTLPETKGRHLPESIKDSIKYTE